MKKYKKVTYTLDQSVIEIIKNRSFIDSISMSKFLSLCIQSTYDLMIDEYYENNKQPLDGIIRKKKHTVPKTFTLPINVESNLSWFSEKLGVKKSHLVSASIINFDKTESEELSQQIDELMKSDE